MSSFYNHLTINNMVILYNKNLKINVKGEIMNYTKYFNGLKEELKNKTSTSIITESIKIFTENFFKNDKNKYVYHAKNKSEFLYDISVLTFMPFDILQLQNKTALINTKFNMYNAFMLIESELGGESASGPGTTFKNVMNDFAKLLIGNSKHKIMIMALSPYKNETNFIQNRLKFIKQVYNQSNCNSEMFLIIIEGYHPNQKKNLSRQIRLYTNKIHSFMLSRNN